MDRRPILVFETSPINRSGTPPRSAWFATCADPSPTSNIARVSEQFADLDAALAKPSPTGEGGDSTDSFLNCGPPSVLRERHCCRCTIRPTSNFAKRKRNTLPLQWLFRVISRIAERFTRKRDHVSRSAEDRDHVARPARSTALAPLRKPWSA